MSGSVLLVGQRIELAAQLQRELSSRGVPAFHAPTADLARDAAQKLRPDIALVDTRTEQHAMLLLRWLQRRCPAATRAVLTDVSKSFFHRELDGGLVEHVLWERDAVTELERVLKQQVGLSPENTGYAIRRADVLERDAD